MTQYGHEKNNDLEFGLPIANPDQFDNSMMDLEKASTIELSSCKDSFTATIANTVSVVSFVLNGETITLDAPVLVSNPKEVTAAIVKALATREFRIDAAFTYVGTTATFYHIGKWAVTSVTTTATTHNTTRACTRVTNCEYVTPVDGALGDLTFNGSAPVAFGSTYDYADGSTDATALRTAVIAALSTAGATGTTVTATLNTTIEAIDLKIVAPRGSVIKFGSVRLAEENCAIAYA